MSAFSREMTNSEQFYFSTFQFLFVIDIAIYTEFEFSHGHSSPVNEKTL